MRYFCPRDLTLRSKMPVIAPNWMNLCLFFLALARNPKDFLEFLVAVDDAMVEAYSPPLEETQQQCLGDLEKEIVQMDQLIC